MIRFRGGSPLYGDDNPMAPVPFIVKRVKHETHDTFSLILSRPARKTALRFRPGQFTMLYVFGVGEAPISISGDPEDPTVLVHTIRRVGSVTEALAKLRTGDSLGVRGPFGSAWPLDRVEGRDVVIMAGGIGLAPLRPAILALLRHKDSIRRLVLLYGARTPVDVLFAKDIGAWRRHIDVQIEVTVDRSDPAWKGHVGVVTSLVPHADFDPRQTVAMICGPEIMMRYSVDALIERGVPPAQIYLSIERNMKCAIGFCGHCQYGPRFICKDGPVFSYPLLAPYLKTAEV